MGEEKGFVIAFHNDDIKYPYLGLTCRERAIKNEKPDIPLEILQELNNGNLEKVLSKISLEAGIIGGDQEVLEFVQEKIENGESIFLDFKEEDAISHNHSEYSRLFLIASIFVTPGSFIFLNRDLFPQQEWRVVEQLVRRSQGGVLVPANTEVDKTAF